MGLRPRCARRDLHTQVERLALSRTALVELSQILDERLRELDTATREALAARRD